MTAPIVYSPGYLADAGITLVGQVFSLSFIWYRSALARGRLPANSLLDGIAQGSAAVGPVKTTFAFLVSSLLQGIEPLDVVDHGSDALRELPHRLKG